MILNISLIISACLFFVLAIIYLITNKKVTKKEKITIFKSSAPQFLIKIMYAILGRV